jgi:hypothetical protein
MPFEAPTTVPPKRRRAPRPAYKLADGTRAPSVTTVLGIIAKPQLIKWANRIGLEGINSDEYRDGKADIGTAAHLLVEHWFKGEVPEMDDDLRALALPGFQHFLRWRAQHEVAPVLLETSFVSERQRYGGTVDMVADIDGVRELVDFKFTARIYNDQFLQLAAYRYLLAENGYPVERVRIVRMSQEENARPAYEEKWADDTTPFIRVFAAALRLYRQKGELDGVLRNKAINPGLHGK